jgi:photosystem II stability/assembly factor-like uncharacterized protein
LKYLLFLFVFCTIAACTPAVNSPHWTPLNLGLPTHATILSLAIDPRDSNKLYAGAYDVPGVYLSTDRARTWSVATNGLDGVPALTLEFIGDDLFAGTINGLFKRQNSRWVRVDSIPAASIYALTDGGDGDYYLATDRHGIYVTTDTGVSWSRIPGLESEILTSIAVLDNQTILAGTGGNGALITRDGGASWHALDLFTGDYVSFITVDPRDRRTIFLRTRWGLFRTRNLGENWEMLQGGIEAGVVNALLITPSLFYAASSAGVLESDDDGASWKVISDRLPENSQPLALARLDAQSLVVGTQTGVYITRDTGSSWQAANNGLGVPLVHSLALKGTGALIAATEDGLYQSDGAGNFQAIGNDAMRVPMLSVSIAPNNPNKIYAGSYRRGIFVSSDAGRSWESAGDIFHGRLAAPGLAINPGDDRVLYARVLFQRIYKSDDGGETWRAVWTGMSDDTEVETMAVAPSNPAFMFAGTNFGVFLSRDGGETWSPSGLSDNSSRWASYQNVFAVWIDPIEPNQVLAGTTDGLYRSSDMGKTWARAGMADYTITAIVRRGGNLFVGTKYAGIWLSRDDGKNWERLGASLSDVSVNALALDEERGVLYAATARGLFMVNLHDLAGMN